MWTKAFCPSNFQSREKRSFVALCATAWEASKQSANAARAPVPFTRLSLFADEPALGLRGQEARVEELVGVRLALQLDRLGDVVHLLRERGRIHRAEAGLLDARGHDRREEQAVALHLDLLLGERLARLERLDGRVRVGEALAEGAVERAHEARD